MTFSLAGLAALLWAGAANPSADIPRTAALHGTVLEASTGRLLADAELQLTSTDGGGHVIALRPDASGHFAAKALAGGDYQLKSNAAGHLPVKLALHVEPGSDQTLDVSLQPELSRHTEAVTVEGNLISDGLNAEAVDRVSLGGENLKNLTTVLADDPLRAIQALPGVAANDDFNAQFSVRGAEFNRIGIFLDGIKLHNAVHSLEGTDLSGSASSFNSALVRQLDLYESSYPERYGDSSAGVLDVHLRDGNADRYSLKLAINLGTAGLSLGGPFGGYTRCTWLAGYRKSYLQYLLARTTTDPSLAFGIDDFQGRATCHVSAAHTISLELIDSGTDLDRSRNRALLGANAVMLVNQRVLTSNLSWTYSPSDRLQIATHAAWMQDKFDAQNPILQSLGRGGYHEKVLNSQATWLVLPHNTMGIGMSLRRLGEDGFAATYNTVRSIRQYNRYRGTGYLTGGYASDTWDGWNNRLHLTGSVRWDRHSVDSVAATSPQAGMTLRLFGPVSLLMGWGQYVQFPELSVLASNLGNRSLLPLRSTQSTAAIDTRLPASLRLRVGVYERRDRDLLYQPWSDPRLLNGALFIPPVTALFANSLHGRSRGADIYLQRSFDAKVEGWISYTYSKTYLHDGVSGALFSSDWDQRHTLNVYTSYRVRPSVNISARWAYGSGFPAPGFYQLQAGTYYLASERNRVRIGPYQRVDLRVNKEWGCEKWKKSLYLEVMNLSNKSNFRFGSLDGFLSNGRALVTVDSLFPILPSVGFVLER